METPLHLELDQGKKCVQLTDHSEQIDSKMKRQLYEWNQHYQNCNEQKTEMIWFKNVFEGDNPVECFIVKALNIKQIILKSGIENFDYINETW